MKVICIDNKPHGTSPHEDSLKKLGEGKEYTVVEFIEKPNPGYLLKEVKSSHKSGAYKRERFIPCSDIDETERIEEVLEQMFVKKEAV